MASINQLSGGEYSCLVSDANNCHTELITVELSEPAMPLLLDSASVIDNYVCNDSSGSVTLSVSGGTPGYQFLWNTGDSNEILENLAEGQYECTITDENGCFFNTGSFIINSPPNDLNLMSDSTPENAGFGDGTATVTPSGGTPPYDYSWDENAASQTDSTATNLMSGTYEVTVSDASGCISTAANDITV